MNNSEWCVIFAINDKVQNFTTCYNTTEDDNMSEREIEDMIMDEVEYSFHYDIEPGYEKYTEVKYRKGDGYED